jgi:hypothetical protein
MGYNNNTNTNRKENKMTKQEKIQFIQAILNGQYYVKPDIIEIVCAFIQRI